jgi:two-component system, cell cycle sensor histidine kinase and response regulator CckA
MVVAMVSQSIGQWFCDYAKLRQISADNRVCGLGAPMNHLQQTNNRSPRLVFSTRLYIGLITVILFCGIGATIWMAKTEDARMRADLLIQAKMVAANILAQQIDVLTGTPADLGQPGYKELKSHLKRTRAANAQCRFVYLTGIRSDGTIVFLVDSEPAESAEFSPPGQPYEEASQDFIQIFETGNAVVEGPVEDRWGSWVSALVAISDPQTAKISAVLGIDVDARNWTRNVIVHCLPAVALTLLLIGMATFFHILFRRSEQAHRRIARSEARLAESERAYRSVVTNMLDIFFRVDAQGIITMLSPSAAKLLGYGGTEEMLGKNIEDLLAHPEQQNRLYEHLQLSGAIQDWEFKARCKDGTQLDMSISANLILDTFEAPVGFEGIARDISERKKAEKQQQEVQAMIQHAQKMETVGALAGGVAHDLNNILSGIVCYPDLLLMQIPEDSGMRESLESIKESGMKAAAVVQDLLTLARRGVSICEVVNLNDLIRAHLKSPEFKKMLSFHPDVTVQTDLDDHLLPIMGSPVHFSKALMNLVFNAAESMPAGGQMVISTCNRHLDFPIKGYDYVQEGEYAVLSIADCGVGISQEDQMRIFEPFYTKKTMGRSGTGLGMAVVWGTVKDHKGYIDLQSTQGEGTVFTLYFPITRELPSDNKIDFSLEKIRGNKETILVIDDVREQRDIAATILTRLGYRVNTRSSGEEAVRYLALNHADLIVLDMIMDPGMGGLETYRQIIAHTPGQRAIIASGYSESQDIQKALEIGAGRYLKKPYTLIGLGMAVWEELHTPDPRESARQTGCHAMA